MRATLSEPADAVTDFVLANRIRYEVLEITEAKLEANPETDEERYWLLATLQEASMGIGDEDEAAQWGEQAREVASAEWMIASVQGQLEKLKAVLSPSPLQFLDSL